MDPGFSTLDPLCLMRLLGCVHCGHRGRGCLPDTCLLGGCLAHPEGQMSVELGLGVGAASGEGHMAMSVNTAGSPALGSDFQAGGFQLESDVILSPV